MALLLLSLLFVSFPEVLLKCDGIPEFDFGSSKSKPSADQKEQWRRAQISWSRLPREKRVPSIIVHWIRINLLASHSNRNENEKIKSTIWTIWTQCGILRHPVVSVRVIMPPLSLPISHYIPIHILIWKRHKTRQNGDIMKCCEWNNHRRPKRSKWRRIGSNCIIVSAAGSPGQSTLAYQINSNSVSRSESNSIIPIVGWSMRRSVSVTVLVTKRSCEENRMEWNKLKKKKR